MQAKDVPDRPVLAFVAEHGGTGCNWYGLDVGEGNPRTVRRAMPADTPEKVVLAKMRSLIKRGLVTGCACGCRGDFEITENGRRALGSP